MTAEKGKGRSKKAKKHKSREAGQAKSTEEEKQKIGKAEKQRSRNSRKAGIKKKCPKPDPKILGYMTTPQYEESFTAEHHAVVQLA